MRDNQLVYEYYSFSEQIWIEGGSLTPSGPNQRVPQSGDSYMLFEQGAIKSFIDGHLQAALTSGQLDLGNKVITGLVSSSDPHSAVTLEQL
jgi:hypothetical protein